MPRNNVSTVQFWHKSVLQSLICTLYNIINGHPGIWHYRWESKPTMQTYYFFWSYRKDIGALQNLDLLALCVGSHRRGDVHRSLPGSAGHPRAALLHTSTRSYQMTPDTDGFSPSPSSRTQCIKRARAPVKESWSSLAGVEAQNVLMWWFSVSGPSFRGTFCSDSFHSERKATQEEQRSADPSGGETITSSAVTAGRRWQTGPGLTYALSFGLIRAREGARARLQAMCARGRLAGRSSDTRQFFWCVMTPGARSAFQRERGGEDEALREAGSNTPTESAETLPGFGFRRWSGSALLRICPRRNV